MAKVIASGIADVFDPDYTGDEFSHEFTIEQDKDGFITLGICHNAGHAERALDEMFDSVVYSVDN